MNSNRTVTVVSPSNAISVTDPDDVGAAMRWANTTAGWNCSTAAAWDAAAPNGAAGPPELRAE